MTRAFLGLGSNIGNTKKYIDDSIKLLSQHSSINIINTSSYYETEPIGYKYQEWFLNVVVEINTSLSPYDLLYFCNSVEEVLKRERLIRWGPRTIDIDILLYGDYISKDEKLTIPHPRMLERAFVMIPLNEIAPNLIIGGRKIEELILELKTQRIRKIDYGR